MQYLERPKSRTDIGQLYQRLGWTDFLQLDAEQLAQAMDQSWYVVYAYDQDRLVGTGRVVSDGVINAYLCGLGVDPEYRSRGIGTEISERLVQRCRQHGLHIQFFCEEQMVPFYEQRGFSRFALGMKLDTRC